MHRNGPIFWGLYRIEEFLAEVDYFTSIVLYHTCNTVSYM